MVLNETQHGGQDASVKPVSGSSAEEQPQKCERHTGDLILRTT